MAFINRGKNLTAAPTKKASQVVTTQQEVVNILFGR